MKARRKIIRIDESKCNGCGLCASACAEGAIKIIDGKARLMSEIYCDGLGACIGECPQGALTIEEREAAEFDEKAVERHMGVRGQSPSTSGPVRRAADTGVRPLPKFRSETSPWHLTPSSALRNGDSPLCEAKEPMPCGCPGTMSQALKPQARPATREGLAPSALGNWPVQLRLAPVFAPYFKDARLVIAADCTAYAFADFHKRFLAGKTLVIGCPKLDDAGLYQGKLARILLQNEIKSVEVLYMEVPCCFGLVRLVQEAIAEAKSRVPLSLTKISIRGEILESSRK